MRTSFTASKMLFDKTCDQRKIRTYEQSSAVILRIRLIVFHNRFFKRRVNKMRRRSKYFVFREHIHGFTLIELLVVISIIALLLSILMPSLQKAKEAARKVICLSNLRSTGMVWSLYTMDNNGVILPVNSASSQWYDELPKYLFGSDTSLFRAKWPEKPGSSILMCPSNKASFIHNDNVYATNYAMNNRCGITWSSGSTSWFPVKSVNIVRPSEKVIFSDARVTNGTYAGHTYKYTWTWSDPSIYYFGVDYWVGRFHGKDGANFMWADGHSSLKNYENWDVRNETDRTGTGWWSLTKK